MGHRRVTIFAESMKGFNHETEHQPAPCFTSEPTITIQYPRETKPIPPTYRGMHILEQEKCIDCGLCAKACPVDCIEIEAEHHGRVLEWTKFSIDYKKCIFCEFCIPPCPVDCIHMTTEFEMATESPDTMVEDMLTWTGLRLEDQSKLEGKTKPKAPAAKPAGGGGDDLRSRVAALMAKKKAEKED
jgi:formate hydrogenlyase subunit 6/NADH:ubiquinone oxidoreductase subunit I